MLNITKKRLYKIKKTKNQTKKRVPKRRKRKKRKKRKKQSFRRGKKSYNLKNKSLKKRKGGGNNDFFGFLKLGETSEIITMKNNTVVESKPIMFNNNPAKLEKLKNILFEVKHLEEKKNKEPYNPLMLPGEDSKSFLQHQRYMLNNKSNGEMEIDLLQLELIDEELFQETLINKLFNSYKEMFKIFNNDKDIAPESFILSFKILINGAVAMNNGQPLEINLEDEYFEGNGRNDGIQDSDILTYIDNINTDTNEAQNEGVKNKLDQINSITLQDLKKTDTDVNDQLNNETNNINNKKELMTAKHLKDLSQFMKIVSKNQMEYNEQLSTIKIQISEERKKTQEDQTGQTIVEGADWLLKRKDPQYLMKTFDIPESYAKFVSNRLKKEVIKRIEQQGGGDEDKVDNELAEMLALFKIVDIRDDIEGAKQEKNPQILANKLKKIDDEYNPDNTSGITNSEIFTIFGIDQDKISSVQNKIKESTKEIPIANKDAIFIKIAEILVETLSPDTEPNTENANVDDELKKRLDQLHDSPTNTDNAIVDTVNDPVETKNDAILFPQKVNDVLPNENNDIPQKDDDPRPQPYIEKDPIKSKKDPTGSLKNGYTRPQVYLHAKLRLDKDGKASDYQPDFTIESFGFHKDAREWLKHVNIDVD